MIRGEILGKIRAQRDFRAENPVISVKIRRELLKKLASKIRESEAEICAALKADLNKSETESYMTEIGLVLDEISYMLRHLRHFARSKPVYTPLSNFPALSLKRPVAYGGVLIISPWNYPFLLSIQPLVDALAAGNTIILKPSEFSPETSRVMADLIAEVFDPCIATSVLGGVVECTILLDQSFDYIFYTGSTRVGEIVMKKAAKHFTPVTLEMGGKSPCIIDQTANLKLAARRIVFGKFLNAGQTCVAPDFILCSTSIREPLIRELRREIQRQYPGDALKNPNYPRIVNHSQFAAMRRLIKKDQILSGGRSNRESLKIEPTLVSADFADKCMKNEIFGPILPILTFSDLSEVTEQLRKFTKPLACYIFSTSRKNQKFLLDNLSFGGGCINDTIMHLANNHLGFGGLRESGLGAYHGKTGFDTFTHYQSLVRKPNFFDLPLRYHPYSRAKDSLIRLFLR